jgi:hypothetical protein
MIWIPLEARDGRVRSSIVPAITLALRPGVCGRVLDLRLGSRDSSAASVEIRSERTLPFRAKRNVGPCVDRRVPTSKQVQTAGDRLPSKLGSHDVVSESGRRRRAWRSR